MRRPPKLFRAGALTNRLLAFSRRQVVQPKILDLNTLIGTLDNMLRRLIGEDIELATSLEPGLGKMKADPSQIEQVIMNLVVNARDAMRMGGRLTLKTANVEIGGEGGRQPAGLRPGAYVSLAVIDTGIGMDTEILNHMFEPFFTTKETGKGTGLGLSTVYGIVKQSGGEISVESEPGKGSVFTIYFPRADECAPLLPSPEPASARLYGERETILLVEDEYGVRKLVRKMLIQQGYRVLEAGDGNESLKLCDQHQGPIDMLLTDVVMPKMSGRELAERISDRYPGIKVLYMTGYTEDAIVHHGVLQQGIAVLKKPFLAEALARKVREVLDSKEDL